MTPQKSPVTTSRKERMLFGYSGIEAETGVERHSIRQILRGVPPDGEKGGHPAWRLDTFKVAAERWQATRPIRGAQGPLKEQKTAEEIRKLKLANDAKAGLLIPRAHVVETFQRIAARIAQARTESEARDPVRLVGKDLADMREGVRGIWDAIGKALAECAVEWRETEPEEPDEPRADS